MDDDLTRRAELLLRILTDPEEWRMTAAENPHRLATILGVCDSGELALANSLIPAVDRIRSGWDRRTASTPQSRSTTMANEEEKDRKEKNREEQIKLAREALSLLKAGLKEKKDKNKLAALCEAWETCGSRKDDLIRKYEDGKVATENKAKAVEIREKLDNVQGLFRTIRRKIMDGEDATPEGREAEDTLERIIKDLISL